jgi:uncharacterized protein
VRWVELDRSAVLSLNADHVEETSPLDAPALEALLAAAFYVGQVARGRDAFLIALTPEADYASPNFQWFRRRGGRFVYIDRVVVANACRGRGLARQLYGELEVAARAAGYEELVCEVNIDPPNPASSAFHRALGFRPVGEAVVSAPKRVQYLSRPL